MKRAASDAGYREVPKSSTGSTAVSPTRIPAGSPPPSPRTSIWLASSRKAISDIRERKFKVSTERGQVKAQLSTQPRCPLSRGKVRR